MFFRKFFYLLDNDYKSLPLFGSLILFVTLLEILSLSILGILVTLLVGQELENSKFYFIFNFFQNFFHKNIIGYF